MSLAPGFWAKQSRVRRGWDPVGVRIAALEMQICCYAAAVDACWPVGRIEQALVAHAWSGNDPVPTETLTCLFCPMPLGRGRKAEGVEKRYHPHTRTHTPQKSANCEGRYRSVQNCAKPVKMGWQIHYPGNPRRRMRMKLVGGATRRSP